MKTSIQFHALPEEMVSLFGEIFADPDVWIAKLESPPQEFVLWGRVRPPAVDPQGGGAWAFTMHEPVLGSRSVHQFVTKNPNALVLTMGRRTGRGLEESWLAANTDDVAATKKWKAVIARVKSRCFTGAVAVSPATGIRRNLKGHFFTEGARNAFIAGEKILPVAGNALIELSL